MYELIHLPFAFVRLIIRFWVTPKYSETDNISPTGLAPFRSLLSEKRKRNRRTRQPLGRRGTSLDKISCLDSDLKSLVSISFLINCPLEAQRFPVPKTLFHCLFPLVAGRNISVEIPIEVDLITYTPDTTVFMINVAFIHLCISHKWRHFTRDVGLPVFIKRHQLMVSQVAVGLDPAFRSRQISAASFLSPTPTSPS